MPTTYVKWQGSIESRQLELIKGVIGLIRNYGLNIALKFEDPLRDIIVHCNGDIILQDKLFWTKANLDLLSGLSYKFAENDYQ